MITFVGLVVAFFAIFFISHHMLMANAREYGPMFQQTSQSIDQQQADYYDDTYYDTVFDDPGHDYGFYDEDLNDLFIETQ